MSILTFDIESDDLLDDLTKIHCLVTKDYETGEVKRYNEQSSDRSVGRGLDALASAEFIVGHNIIGFDVPAIQKLYPDWKAPKVFDTLVATRLIWSDIKDQDFRSSTFPKQLVGSHKLEAWGYRIGLKKGDFGESTDWKEWSMEMEDYCEQDVFVTHQLYKRILAENYSQEALDLEHSFAELIAMQERHGFCFDKEKAVELYTTLSKRRRELERELQEVFPPTEVEMKTPRYWYALVSCDDEYRAPTKTALTKKMKDAGFKPKDWVANKGPMKIKEIPFNPGSRQEIEKRLVAKYSWKPKDFTPSGQAKINDEVLVSLPYEECKPLAEYFMIQKRIGQVAEGESAWLKLEKKGRIHGYVNTNGAVTGRCTHNSPNVAQVPAVRAAYGKECRSCFKATDGWSLVGWDASGLELRCLAHYLALYDSGAYATVLLDGDIHTHNQKAAGLKTRDQAKTFIYGWLYGAGDAKIGQIVGKGARVGKQLRTKFMAANPAIKKLSEAVKKTYNNRGYFYGLDGRKLHLRSEHSALNTLLQSAGALVMKKSHCIHWELIQEAGYVWGEDVAKVNDVHDEAQWEVRPEIAEHVGKLAIQAIKKAGEHFSFRCPLDGEYKIGKNWAETH